MCNSQRFAVFILKAVELPSLDSLDLYVKQGDIRPPGFIPQAAAALICKVCPASPVSTCYLKAKPE
jgi:hypothetical protein